MRPKEFESILAAKAKHIFSPTLVPSHLKGSPHFLFSMKLKTFLLYREKELIENVAEIIKKTNKKLNNSFDYVNIEII